MFRETLSLLFFGFPEKEREKEFLKRLHDPGEIRVIIGTGSCIYLLFHFIDFYLFREHFAAMIVLRSCVFLPFMLLLIGLTFTSFYHSISTVLIVMVAYISSGGIIVMEYLVRDSQYADMVYYGIFLVIIFYYGNGKSRPFIGIPTGGFIAAAAIFVDVTYIESDPRRITLKIFYLVSMMVIGNILSMVVQYSARQQFLKQRQIEDLSITDQLTGLKNRLFFNDFIRREIQEYWLKQNSVTAVEGEHRQANIEGRQYYGVMLLDIDHFKVINDTYGHEAGDCFLQEFSERITKIIRPCDVLIRWGGEEFLIILRFICLQGIDGLSGRILDCIADKPFDLGSAKVQGTVSGGYVLIPPDQEDSDLMIDHMIDMADQALYFSKKNGRNRMSEAIYCEDGQKGHEFREIVRM